MDDIWLYNTQIDFIIITSYDLRNIHKNVQATGHNVVLDTYVIVDKSTCLKSMTAIFSDATKFQETTEPIRKYNLKIEDKFNIFLAKSKKLQGIEDDTYDNLYATGTAPGILYDLPKIHNQDFANKFQYRPNSAAYNQVS